MEKRQVIKTCPKTKAKNYVLLRSVNSFPLKHKDTYVNCLIRFGHVVVKNSCTSFMLILFPLKHKGYYVHFLIHFVLKSHVLCNKKLLILPFCALKLQSSNGIAMMNTVETQK